MRNIIIWVLIGTALACDCAFAGVFAYECEVLSEQRISDDGVLEPGLDIYIGKSFHVERRTGVVLGGGFGNSAYPTKSILDLGNDSMSYKLLWVSKPIFELEGSHNVVYLEIKEWAETMLKPFILIHSGTVLTGSCS